MQDGGQERRIDIETFTTSDRQQIGLFSTDGMILRLGTLNSTGGRSRQIPDKERRQVGGEATNTA